MTNKSLTRGSIGKGILYFMIPLVASNLIVTCLVGFFTGMSVGTGVITSHAFGEKNDNKLKNIISTTFLFGIIGGIVLMIIGIVFAHTVLKMMNTPDTILKLSTKYLRIYMFSMIAIVIYNLCSGVVRSLGDSKTPMRLQIYGGIINVIADIIFIIILKMGVEGAAIATFLSQSLVAVLIIIYLIKLKPEIALNLKDLNFSKNILFFYIKKLNISNLSKKRVHLELRKRICEFTFIKRRDFFGTKNSKISKGHSSLLDRKK